MTEATGLPFDPEDAKTRHAAIMQRTFTLDLRAFIDHATIMFVATAGADGRVDVSPKGGRPGFVQVMDDRTVAWGEKRGNTMYMTGGNLTETGRAALCFFDPFTGAIARVNGTVELEPGNMDGRFPEAEYCVVLSADEIFPNCGRALQPFQEYLTAVLRKAVDHTRDRDRAQGGGTTEEQEKEKA